MTTDIPEFSDLDPLWNTQSRGIGATPQRPVSVAAEENALCYSDDAYTAEDIVLHVFAHGLDILGIRSADPSLYTRLQTIYENAKENNLWTNTYAIANIEEYFVSYIIISISLSLSLFIYITYTMTYVIGFMYT